MQRMGAAPRKGWCHLAQQIIVAQRAEILELRRLLQRDGWRKPEYTQCDALFRF